MPGNPIRVLVVDDSSFMRTMLARMIGKDPRFEVIDHAENGQVAVEKTKDLRPDVVTMDVEMPVMNGLQAVEQIMAQCPVPVVMVSALTEAGAQVTMEALAKGAVDFLPKALQDEDKNVFKAAGALHDKLYAAAHARVSPQVTAAPTPVAAPQPAAEDVAKRVQSSVGSAPVGGGTKKLVVIGTSTGGPRALAEVIPALPANLPVPVLIAQHMPENFTTALAKRLDETSSIKVKEAEHGETLQPGVVYIAPGGKHMRITGAAGQAVVQIAPDQGESLYKPSVDVLATSVAQVYGGQTMAVMLTGMGNDGVKAFVALKQSGGYVVAQDEATCTVYGMPKALMDVGGADVSLPLGQVAGKITQSVG